MRFLDLHYQVELPLKAVVAKIGKNHLKRSDFDFFAFFWSSSQETYCSSALYQFLEPFEPSEALFLKKSRKPKISSFFQIFFLNGYKSAKTEPITSVNAPYCLFYFIVCPHNIKKMKKSLP